MTPIPYIACVVCQRSFPANGELKTCSLDCHRIWFRKLQNSNPPIIGEPQ